MQINRDSNDDPTIHEEAKKLFNKMEHSKIQFIMPLSVITNYLCLASQNCIHGDNMVSIERKKVIIVSNYFVQGEVDDLPLWKKFRDISIKRIQPTVCGEHNCTKASLVNK